jgi:RecA/RadA recombinase
MARKKKTEETPAEPLADAVEGLEQNLLARYGPPPREDRLSTGCTLLNLALSGRPKWGLAKGWYLWFVGDSSSGKTWFNLQLLAEAAKNPHFDGHRFVVDDIEHGGLMDVVRYFGAAVASRIVPPAGTRAEPVYSGTVQELYYNIDANLDQGPCIYIVDSMDALGDEDSEEKFEAEKTVHLGGSAKVPGSMGMQKAKTNSQNINRVVRRLRETGSIMSVIGQTRSKTGGHIPNQKTVAGGFALKFYAHAQVWARPAAPITKTVLGLEREVGRFLELDVQKNRVSGWEGKLTVPFYRAHGIDDLGGLVDWLVAEKVWTKAEKGSKVDAPELDFSGSREALIAKIEAEDREQEVRALAGKRWQEIEEASAPKRKPRYV